MKKLLSFAILLLCFSLYCVGVWGQCNMQATFTKTNSSCEANGTVTIRVVDTTNFEEISGGLFAKTGSSYPSGYQLGITNLQNVPPGIYDVKVRAKCKITGITEGWELGEVKITSDYIVPNMYVFTANIVNSLKGTNQGRIPFVFSDGKAPYTVTMKSYPGGYAGDTVFVLNQVTSGQQGTLTIKDLPPGKYTFNLRDDCGTNTANLPAEVLEYDMPLIKHHYYYYSDSLRFNLFQLDDKKKIGIQILSYYNHKDLQYHFPCNSNSSGYPATVQYQEEYMGTDTIRQFHNGYTWITDKEIDTTNIGLTHFDFALIENGNTANKIMGKWVKQQTSYSKADYGSGRYRITVAWTPYYEVELQSLKFKDLYGALGTSGGFSPAGFMLRLHGATDWYPKVNPIRTKMPYGNFMFDNTNCGVGGNLYVMTNYGGRIWNYYPSGSEYYYDNYNHVIAYPVTAEVYNASNVKVLSKTFPYVPMSDYSNQKSDLFKYYSATKDTLMGNLPYGNYRIKFKDADGVYYDSYYSTLYYNNAEKDTIKYIDYKYNLQSYKVSVCRDDGKTGYAYLRSANIDNINWNYNSWWSGNNNKYSMFYPGTVIRYKSGPPGQVIPAPITIPDDKKTLAVYLFVDDPWNTSSYNHYAKIEPGEHIFEIESPCGTKTEIKFTMPAITPSYSTVIRNIPSGSCHTSETFGKYEAYIRPSNSSDQFSLGTKFECIEHPLGSPPRHMSVTTSTNFYTFYPFAQDYTGVGGTWGDAAPGVYKFKITDGACSSSPPATITITVPNPFIEKEDLAFTLEPDCSGDKLYPTGKLGYYHTNGITFYDTYTRFWIHKLVLENGKVSTSGLDYAPANTIAQGDFIQLKRNGTYTLAMGTGGNCRGDNNVIQYKEIKYKQRLPELDGDQTYAYLCVDESVAYVGLVAKGGYGNGPYIYKLITRSGDTLTNTTGVFQYGSALELLEYIIIDDSQEAKDLDCQGFLHKKDRIVLDLSNPSLVYSPTGGRYCAGDTLIVNCQSLGPTAQYLWTLPDGSTRTTQNIKIPNASPSMNGWYKVSVIPSFCNTANPVRDSMYIRVYDLPTAPTVRDTVLEGCYSTTSFNLETASGAQASPTCILKWYKYTGVILTELTNLNVAFNNYTDQVYYVKQVFTTVGCEGPMTKVTVKTLYTPPGPGFLPIATGCFNDSLKIEIFQPQDTLKYRLYTTNNILLQEIQGNSASTVFHTVYPQYRYYISAVGTGCESQKVQVPVTLNPSAPSGRVTISGDRYVCFNDRATLTAVADTSIHNPVYYWYASATDTATLLHTGPVFITPPISASGYQYFYVAVKGDNYCESFPNYRANYWVNNNNTAGNQVRVNNSSVVACSSYSGTFTATTTPDTIVNPVFNWYDKNFNLVHTGPTFTVSNITQDTLYYVTVKGDNMACESSGSRRATVTITMGAIDSLDMRYEHLIGCDNFGSTVFTKIVGGTTPFEYKFDNDTVWYNIGSLREIVIPGLVSGSHTIWVKNALCGEISKTIVIPTHPEDEVDTTLLSYSDGPATYGIASHIISGCVYLGNLELNKIQSVPAPSVFANTAQNDNGLDLVYGGDGFVDIVNSGFRVEGNNLVIEFNATNKTLMTGKVLVWLDVNRDGRYGTNELFGTVNVPAASNDVTFKVQRTNPYQWLRNGNSYLRFRHTTQTIVGSDVTDPYRKLGNGEVEDYLLELSDDLYTFEKSVQIKGMPGATETFKGDTLIYTIDFVNNTTYQMCYVMYDSIPANTTYVTGSGGTLYGSGTKRYVQWPSVCLTAGQSAQYTFSVVVNDKVDAIYNKAYLRFSSAIDTVYSNTVVTRFENYVANDDNVILFACDTALVDIMANDNISAGSSFTITSTPSYGTVSVVGSQLKYISTGGSLANCCLSGGRNDVVKYKVCSSNGKRCSEANVGIYMLHCPGIVLLDSCSTQPRIHATYQLAGTVYRWYYSDDGGTSWVLKQSGSEPNLFINEEGLYKLELEYNGVTKKIPKAIDIHLVKKTVLPGNIIFYNMTSSFVDI